MITEIKLSDKVYYNHKEALCFTCQGFGKELGEIGGGDFDRGPLTIAELGTIDLIATQHHNTYPKHNIRVITYSK